MICFLRLTTPGRTTLSPSTGTPNDGTFQVFITDKTENAKRFMIRRGALDGVGGEGWSDYVEMAKVD